MRNEITSHSISTLQLNQSKFIRLGILKMKNVSYVHQLIKVKVGDLYTTIRLLDMSVQKAVSMRPLGVYFIDRKRCD